MNAIKHLEKEHREIKDLFSQFEEAGERAYKKKQTIAQKVIAKIHSHAQQEEQIFYPAVLRKADKKETRELVLEGIEEHRIADFMMERLRTTVPEDETYSPKFKAFSESVTHHLEEEESQLFPDAKKILADELEPLGAEMEALGKKIGRPGLA